MRRLSSLLTASLLTAAVALSACSKKADDSIAVPKPAAPVAPVAPPAGKAWTDVISATSDGGYVVGNPSAAVKLVEYGSFTCPHCARFEKEGAPKLLESYIPSGRVSWEFRPMSIHGAADVVASLLVACRGPGPYVTLAQQTFANQNDYVEKAFAFLNANQARLQSLDPAAQFKEVAKAGGLYAFFGARGLTTAQIDACLSDQKALDAFTAAQQQAQVLGINSTPSFLVNGNLLADVGEWSKLEPVLKQALGG